VRNKLESLSKEELIEIANGRRKNSDYLWSMIVGLSSMALFRCLDATFGSGIYATPSDLACCITAVFMILLPFHLHTNRKLCALIELLRKSNVIT